MCCLISILHCEWTSLCAFFRELKDNLGSDEPEGDAPVLLQTMLARNPGIFREQSMEIHTCCTLWREKHTVTKSSFMLIFISKCFLFILWTDVMQQPMVQPYKITQNSMHSPAQSANFQPAAISTNPPRWACSAKLIFKLMICCIYMKFHGSIER